ncbi:hypothetical protein [Nocardia sp. NPDC058497]|uniref:hypothetical protein n=1 Tax=Nocardia sp. NPDC058497 TaxID=3346529 RepID=UPI003657C2E2
MRSHDPLAGAADLDPFDFRALAAFNDAEFCRYFGDRFASSDWELHPDTDELLMVRTT